ncbi:MAG: biotin/lipoyl-containing protein [Bacteroidia bacterium]
MYKIKVNKKFDFVTQTNGVTGKTTVDESIVEADISIIKENLLHLIINNQSFTAEIVSADFKLKEFQIRINNNIYVVEAQDKYDELLKKMGFDLKNNLKADNIKAPMPGLVLEVKVADGQKISKGDPVVVLEAMKMENILKAVSDGIVKRVAVVKGDKVEKNDLLIEMT